MNDEVKSRPGSNFIVHRSSFIASFSSALFWAAGFAFACTWFFSANKLLRDLPPTDPVAIGKVTVDGVSKARDYAGAALFYVLVPVLTVLFARLGRALHARLTRSAPIDEGFRLASAALFVWPLLASPFFFLTTRKELWGIFLPPLLGILGARALLLYQTRTPIRLLFAPEHRPYHWLLVCEAASWLIFRYLVTGTRIAHIHTLFLEVVFVAFFLGAFWLLGYFIARVTSLVRGQDTVELLECFALGSIPLLLLPVAGLFLVSKALVLAIVLPITAVTVAIALRRRVRWNPRAVQKAIGWGIAPALLFCISYASIAHLSQWIDLFHRGESLGPASDYLRGKVPYRDVFVLHGMLENGLLDSWLMELFGRRLDIALTRVVALAALTIPLTWWIAFAMFDSIPLSLAASVLAYGISADNQRALPILLVALVLLIGVKRSSRPTIVLSGALAGFAVFYSLDMGLYSVAGGVVSLLLLAWLTRAPAIWILDFLLGLGLGSAPFALYLMARNALAEFFRTSFLTVPSIIDAVWSLPFPDFTPVFRDFSVRTVADFVLTERFRFILNPLVLGIAASYLAARLHPSRRGDAGTRRRGDDSSPRPRVSPSPRRGGWTGDAMLLTLVVFGVLTQRSALGRADFPHQYFAAFFIPPILVALVISLTMQLKRYWPTLTIGEKATLTALSAVAVLVGVTVLWLPDLLSARLDSTIQYRSRLSRIGFADPRGEQQAERIRTLQTEVRKLTTENDPVFDFSNQPGLYFFTNRMNPTRFYQVPILSPIDLQMEAIEDLAGTLPTVVFRRSPDGFHLFDGLDNDLRAAAVAAFLDDHYAFHKNVRGIELWRLVRRQARPIQEYRRAFTLPSQASLAPKQRFVFPAVGSVRGAAGSVWQSDLVLHNPHSAAASIRLRYLWSSGARDRALNLLPNKSVQVRDFVHTLFAEPNTRGMLWVEYPADRRPLVRVTTYDVARGGEASVDPPLFETDAATAEGPLNQLTIVGARGGGDVRVNLGVINMGEAPALFRITTTTAAGDIIGVPIQFLLQEDQSYLLVDAGRELGAPFQQPLVVGIRILSGKAIGYASLVDSGSGTHQFIPADPTHAP